VTEPLYFLTLITVLGLLLPAAIWQTVKNRRAREDHRQG
jgi:hypothetical protein